MCSHFKVRRNQCLKKRAGKFHRAIDLYLFMAQGVSNWIHANSYRKASESSPLGTWLKPRILLFTVGSLVKRFNPMVGASPVIAMRGRGAGRTFADSPNRITAVRRTKWQVVGSLLQGCHGCWICVRLPAGNDFDHERFEF